ncbi:hypothetical protein BB561_004939 [Smittium simulii]|uniref:RRM domain-containing protein n=1 Tax=Smittium simulii TaxID=133385 RepID=A0A2T9YD62_9FUNG|nr:hypothetical protein BB561_004939 [Smittium simulii]
MQKRKTLNKEAEEEARVYEEFIAAFEEKDDFKKEFIKAGTSVDGLSISTVPKSSTYFAQPKVVFNAADSFVDSQLSTLGDDTPLTSTTASLFIRFSTLFFCSLLEKFTKKRNLDTFLEEIKRGQEEREERLKNKKALTDSGINTNINSKSLTLMAAFENNPGSHEVGDETTTNIYVGNLSPNVNEEMLLEMFGKYGSIGSVKIMWPRKLEEAERARNSGFVCFMDRSSAAAALKALDGMDLMGYELRLCWGKSVILPPKPIYTQNFKPNLLSGFPFNAKLPPKARGGYCGSLVIPGEVNNASQIPEVQVEIPVDIKILNLIHKVCEYVIKLGPKFEEMLMIKEYGSKKFAFLFNNELPEHIYYRWKLYSLLNGDPVDSFRQEMFYMFTEGPIWIPPNVPKANNKTLELTDSSQEEENENYKTIKTSLGTVGQNRLNRRLDELNTNRGSIARAMAFSIEHAEAADQVSQIICEYSYNEDMPHHLLLARLFLVSDILHNCSASVFNAWKFRQSFEKYLPTMFRIITLAYKQISARLKAEQFRKNVLSVLAVLEAWLIFSKDFLGSLAQELL